MAQKLSGMRVAVIVADGFEQVEVTSPVSALEKQGAEVEIISLRRGKIRGMNLLWMGKSISADRTIFTADPDDYDALLIPGGFVNPDFLRQSNQVLKFVREFNSSGKPIATLCHGPWVLASAGLVKGRTLTSWRGIKDDIINAGGNWQNKGVVRDGNWVSAQSPKNLIGFNSAVKDLFSEYYEGRAHAQQYAGSREEREALTNGEGTPDIVRTLGAVAAGAALVYGVYQSVRRVKAHQRQYEHREDTVHV